MYKRYDSCSKTETTRFVRHCQRQTAAKRLALTTYLGMMGYAEGFSVLYVTLPTKRYLYRADNSINPADNGITQCLS
jgi:hypothetical protein